MPQFVFACRPLAKSTIRIDSVLADLYADDYTCVSRRAKSGRGGVVRKSLVSVISMAIALMAEPGLTHHSFSAEFDVGRTRSNLPEPITRVEWTNPHAWLFMVTEDADGNLEDWAVELLGINVLMRRGLNRDSIKPGDRLSIEGFGARDGSNTANASLVTDAQSGEELWASTAGDRRN